MARVSPRKRPIQERSRATVDAILQAAGQVLVAEGLAGATTHRIAERAGVSVGTLYQYFGNKDAVFAELQARYAENLVQKMAELESVLLDAPIDEAIVLLVHTLLESFLEKADVARAVVDHRIHFLDPNERIDRHRRAAEILALGLSRRGDELAIDDYDLAGFFLVKTWEVLITSAIAERPVAVHDGSFEREMVALYTRYLRGH